MVSKISGKSLLVFLGIIHLTISKSALRSKRSGDGLESILEQQIASFPPEAFVTDMRITQHVDRANKISQYKFSNEADYIYERSHDDSSKDAVVLTQEEDKLPFKKAKRAYVVLKKSPQALTYFAELAILRDATAQDKSTVVVNGTNRVIEWVYYDDHLIQGRLPLTLVTLTCASSILVPCLFNEAALSPPEKFLTAKRYSAKASPKNLQDEVQAAKLQTADGSDSDDNYDLYADLEVNKVQGRGVFGDVLGYGLIPGTLSGASGLICGVLMILGMCGKKGGTDVEIINNSGQALTPEQIQMAMMGKRRKRDASDMDRVLDYPGWKTQYVKPSKDITLQNEEEIFYGFGNCPYVQTKGTELGQTKSQEDVINFYARVLRADCLLSTKLMIQELIKDGLIVLNDKTFDLVPDHKSLNQPKLTLKELLGLSTATEISAFSSVYSQQAKEPLKPDTKFTAPGGPKQLSRSTHFIVQVGLTYLKLTREKTRSHILHLTRNLIQNLNSVFGKLAQDNQNLESCPDCTKDKEVNLNDRVYVMALTQFIKRGLGPVERGAEIFATFETFYKGNEPTILKFVEVYT